MVNLGGNGRFTGEADKNIERRLTAYYALTEPVPPNFKATTVARVSQ